MSPIVICTKRGDSGCHHVVVLTTRECRQLFAVESFQLDQHQRSNVNVLNGSDIVALLAGAGACSLQSSRNRHPCRRLRFLARTKKRPLVDLVHSGFSLDQSPLLLIPRFLDSISNAWRWSCRICHRACYSFDVQREFGPFHSWATKYLLDITFTTVTG